VRDSDRGGIPADHNIHPVVPFPEGSNLNGPKAARFAKRLQDLASDADANSLGVRLS
jgi:hypothetical protein